ncbi:MAG: hypothetical protein JWO37_3167 [Acidimicrobiales bacterium]|nr:hypothetical protein [Acidimicrobiales bacterium]
MNRSTRRRMGTVALLFGMLVLTVGFVTGPAQASAARGDAGPSKKDPTGDNGTVKIHDVGDPQAHPDNDPHVTCPFEIDFYNFDANQHLNASITAQPPSGSGEVVWTGDITADPGTTDADNPGAGKDFDGDIAVSTLDLSGLTEHPIQGFHLELTITGDAGDGITKHKVFWVKGCGTQGSTTTEGSTTTTEGSTTTTEGSTTTTEGSTTTTEGSTTTTRHDPGTPVTSALVLGNDLQATSTTATVLGEVLNRTAAPVAAAQLPRTGSSIVQWGVPLGIALVLLGLVLLSYENLLAAAKS